MSPWTVLGWLLVVTLGLGLFMLVSVLLVSSTTLVFQYAKVKMTVNRAMRELEEQHEEQW